MPSAFHVQQEAAASLAAQPTNGGQEYQPRQGLIPGDVCVGCIVWLPPRNIHEEPIVCNKDSCCGGAALPNPGYNHPVVVLSVRERESLTFPGDPLCSVACITSFDKTPLAAYLKKRPRRPHYKKTLPIFESDDDFSNNTTLLSVPKLVLESGHLRKQSYVRLEHTYNIRVSMLEQYTWNHCRAYKKRLSNTSYNILMGELGLVPEVFENTATLWETENRRLSALTNSVRRSQNIIPTRNVADLQQPIRFPPVYQHLPVHVSYPTVPPASYGTTSTTRTPQYLPYSHSYTPVYSNPPEPSGEDSFSSFFKYFLGVLVVGSVVWWKYSR